MDKTRSLPSSAYSLNNAIRCAVIFCCVTGQTAFPTDNVGREESAGYTAVSEGRTWL